MLRLLSESKGLILDDEELIAALAGAKSVSDVTAERVKVPSTRLSRWFPYS